MLDTLVLLALSCAHNVVPARSVLSRRAAVAGATLFTSSFAVPRPVTAFPNGVAEMALYASQPKTPGQTPKLGLQDNGMLKQCDYAPNCFSTSGDDTHLLKMWKPKAGSDAMAELLEVVKAYPPGQAGVDKGGFAIKVADPKYVYVQYESLKYGFIDDVEFALDDHGVQVRSASREGYLDFNVNGKRLNWISAKLRAKGWDAPEITKTTHPSYFGGGY